MPPSRPPIAPSVNDSASTETTTEVALMRSFREDLYTIVGTVDPQSKRATFKFHVNPFVSWIWVGLMVLISGVWNNIRSMVTGRYVVKLPEGQS